MPENLSAMFPFAALGAFILWLRLRYGANPMIGIDELVKDILEDFQFIVFVQLIFFVALGAFVAIVMTEPGTIRQALASGLGWTGLFGGLAGARRSRTGKGSS